MAEVMTCPKCGGTIEIGGWPFCPDHSPGASFNAQANDIPGGLTLENLDHEPVTVYSRSELRREMKARGLVEFVRHVPVPGSDKSPHTTSWSSVDLDAGKALAERQAHTRYVDSERHDPAILATIKDVYEQLSAKDSR
jgi:hypothetical protein